MQRTPYMLEVPGTDGYYIPADSACLAYGKRCTATDS